jgi:thioredoxin reductase
MGAFLFGGGVCGYTRCIYASKYGESLVIFEGVFLFRGAFLNRGRLVGYGIG